MYGDDPRDCAPPSSSSAGGAAQGRRSEAAHHHQQYQQSSSSFSLFKSPHDQPSKRQRLQADLARRTEQYAPHPRYHDSPPPPPHPPQPTGPVAHTHTHTHAHAHSGAEYEARSAQREFEDARHYLLGRADWTGVQPPPPLARAQETAKEGDRRDDAEEARRGRLLERAAGTAARGPEAVGGSRRMNADDPLAPPWHDQHQQYQHSVGRSELDDEWSYRCADLQEPQDEDQDEEADELEMIRQSQSCAPPVFQPPAQPPVPAQAEVRVEARAEVEAPTECKQRKAAQETRERELSPLPPSPAFIPIVSRRSSSGKGQRQPSRSKAVSTRESTSFSSGSGTATASRPATGTESGAFDLERELEHGEEQEDQVALLAPPRLARARGRSSASLTTPGESDADADHGASADSGKSDKSEGRKRAPNERSETPRAATLSVAPPAARASASSPAPHHEPVPAFHGPSAQVIREAHSDPVRPAVTLLAPASSDRIQQPEAPSPSLSAGGTTTFPQVAPLIPLPSNFARMEPLHPLPTKPAFSEPGPEHKHEEDERDVEPEAKSEASTAPSSTQAELLRLEQELDQVRSVIHAKVQRALFGPPFAAAAAAPSPPAAAPPTQGSRR